MRSCYSTPVTNEKQVGRCECPGMSVPKVSRAMWENNFMHERQQAASRMTDVQSKMRTSAVFFCEDLVPLLMFLLSEFNIYIILTIWLACALSV